MSVHLFLSISDLGQLGSADQRVGLLQQSPPGTLVVERAVVGLGVAVRGAEVVTTSTRERGFQTRMSPDMSTGLFFLRNIMVLNHFSQQSDFRHEEPRVTDCCIRLNRLLWVSRDPRIWTWKTLG